jgi:hypothetical protein
MYTPPTSTADTSSFQPIAAQARSGTYVGKVDTSLLSLAASSAGLPLDWLDRVALVEQPAVSHDVQKGFEQQFLAMQAATVAAIQAASLPLICTINTAGTAWLLLAFPGGTEADARRMFSVKDSDTGADGVLRIALAGPAYTGVAVLASCLLGCAPVHHVMGEQQDCVFWREAYTHIDPNEWSFGCFKTRDQLLPVFLILFDGRIASSSRNEGQASDKDSSDSFVCWNPDL